jgi:prephenate dehydrogenase
MVRNLSPHFAIKVYDPSPEAAAFAQANNISMAALADVAGQDIVVLGAPIPKMAALIAEVAPHIKAGSLVLDVCSVKVKPALWMKMGLPPHADIVATHPLFGPQSAPDSVKGHKIAVCNVRGTRGECVAAFLRDVLELDVLITTPEEHDFEVAHIQGLTHMIARILVEMEPLPRTMTTKSFDVLMQAVEIVRYNSMELFLSIERDNPFAADVHQKFFRKVEELRQFLRSHDAWEGK